MMLSEVPFRAMDRRKISAFYDEHLRKKPRQSRSRSVVEAIIAAGLENLTKDGEEGLTLQGVAARAGVGIGSLYDYFRDRQSLLASVTAKVTEDNLRAFEVVLEGTKTLPIEEVVAEIMDFTFDTYAKDTKKPRSLLRIATAAGLMTTLAESQTAFSKTLAVFLRERTDVKVADPERAAYVIVHTMMGQIHTLVWENTHVFEREKLREELIALYLRYLKG